MRMKWADTITRKNSSAPPIREASPLRILVPVDATASAFHSLEFALNLARTCDACIQLLYLTDIDNLPESSNPVVVNRMLDRLERKAYNCVESLTEMIEETGVSVHSAESITGNVWGMLERKIELLRPGLVIIGKESFSKRLVHNLIAHATCPVLVIPASAPSRLPSSFALSFEKRPSPFTLGVLPQILKHTAVKLSMLTTEKYHGALKKVEHYLASKDYSINLDYTQEPLSSHTVERFLEAKSADLLCVTRKNRSFIARIFHSCKVSDMVARLTIPVLVLKEE